MKARQIPQNDIDAKSHAYQANMQEMADILRKALNRAVMQAKADISSLLRTYAYKEGMSTAEARIWLSIPADQRTTSDLIRMAREMGREDLVDDISRKAYAFRYSRQESLLAVLELAKTKTASLLAKRLAPTIESTIMEAHGRAVFEFSKSVNVGFNFSKIPQERISDILRSELSQTKTLTYVGGIIKQIKTELITGIILGKSTKAIGNAIQSTTGTAGWRARAIARTAMTEVSKESEKRVMRDLGVKRYRYRATLDERTCPVCGKLDGTTHNLDDEQAGKNSPPMHMNCRCTVSVVVSDKVRRNAERIARDSEGRNIRVPATMTYEEWKRAFVD